MTCEPGCMCTAHVTKMLTTAECRELIGDAEVVSVTAPAWQFVVRGQPDHEHQTQRVIGSLHWTGDRWAPESEWFECLTCDFTTRSVSETHRDPEEGQ